MGILFHYSKSRFARKRGYIWRSCTTITRWKCRYGVISLKNQPLPSFLGKNTNHRIYRHDQSMRHTPKATTAGNLLITNIQVTHCIHAKVDHDFAILNISFWYSRLFTHFHCQIRS